MNGIDQNDNELMSYKELLTASFILKAVFSIFAVFLFHVITLFVIEFFIINSSKESRGWLFFFGALYSIPSSFLVGILVSLLVNIQENLFKKILVSISVPLLHTIAWLYLLGVFKLLLK